MKRFTMGVVVLAAGSLALTACGNAEKEKAMQAQIDSCSKDKLSSEAKANELKAKVEAMTKEMAEMKAAATPAATPEPAKAAGKTAPKGTKTAPHKGK